MTNAEVHRRFPVLTEDDILRRTGIESRPRLGHHETALTLAVDASREALRRENMSLRDIDLIVCSTTTPVCVTPSTACLLLHELCGHEREHEIPALDISAACSGYLYALASAFDFLQSHRNSNVLVVTTEALSRIVDSSDLDTWILFGDAASATILSGPESDRSPWVRLRRPILSARGEDSRIPSIGTNADGRLRINGRRVFPEAVKRMTSTLGRACAEAGLLLGDLDHVVPHQANGRIIDAIRSRLNLPAVKVHERIRYTGNTSSTSIPLCLSMLAADRELFGRVGLTAFGGGLTFGAAILEVETCELSGVPGPVFEISRTKSTYLSGDDRHGT